MFKQRCQPHFLVLNIVSILIMRYSNHFCLNYGREVQIHTLFQYQQLQSTSHQPTPQQQQQPTTTTSTTPIHKIV